jgi:hypothetical protein
VPERHREGIVVLEIKGLYQLFGFIRFPLTDEQVVIDSGRRVTFLGTAARAEKQCDSDEQPGPTP